jgi:peptidoglycan/LPS O-acetylase OafA/YrhL
VLRILPAYWVALLASGFVLGTAWVTVFPLKVGYLTTHPGLFMADLFLAQGFHPATFATGIGPAWSLCAEAAFYVVLPCVAWLAGRAIVRASGSGRARVWAAAFAPLCLAVMGLIGHVLDAYVFPGPLGSFAYGWHSVIDRGFLGQADGFAWGMAVAVLLCYRESGRGVELLTVRRRLLLEAGFLATSVVIVLRAPELISLLLPVPFAFAVAYVALNQHRRDTAPLLRVLDSRVLVATGLASYSVFLWNVPILALMQRWGLVWGGYAGFVPTLALLAVLTAAVATISYRYVEAPAMALARRPPTRSRVHVADEQPTPAGVVAGD